MSASDSPPDRSDRAGRRSAFLAGPPAERPAALELLLERDGVLLATDDELLTHVDFWLAADPLGGPYPGILARQARRRQADRDALLVRGSRGRTRDRVRAARVLGAMPELDEDENVILLGLLRDPVGIVLRAAARSVWSRARASPGLREWAVRQARSTEPAGALRRSLVGGLAGSVDVDHPEHAGAAATFIEPLLLDALKHKDRPAGEAAARACGEAAALAPGEPLFRGLFDEVRRRPEVELLRPLALGLLHGGRGPGRRSAARALAAEVAATAEQRTPGSAPEQVALATARLVLEAVGAGDDRPGGGPCAPGVLLERAIAVAAREPARAIRHPAALLRGLAAALRRPDEEFVGSSDDASKVAGPAAIFSEVARCVFEEDVLGPLFEVVPCGSERRRALRRAMQSLADRIVRLANRMASSGHFIVQREGMHALALAADSHVHVLRGRATELIVMAAASGSKRQAAGALARLLDRLRLDDPDGFIEVALRLFLQCPRPKAKPKAKPWALLTRVTELSPDPDTRDYLSGLERAARGLHAGPTALGAALLLEGILDEGAKYEERAVGLPRRLANPVMEALEDLWRTLRHLGGDRDAGSTDGLGRSIEVLARCERNLLWREQFEPSVAELSRFAGRIGNPPEPEQLGRLAEALEREGFGSPLSLALIGSLRGARKAARRRDVVRARKEQECRDYHLVKRLARSDLSVVCLGMHKDTRRLAILKFPTDKVLQDKAARRRFLDEGRLLRRLPAEHIVRVEEVVGGRRPMLVLQRLHGESLDRHSRARDRAWVLRRFLEVLRGLGIVHEHGIVHRDLKPSNVVVVPSGRAVLIDFGVAYLERRAPGPGESAGEGLLGTLPYMAPEQWRGESPVPATDVYALGVMLHEVFAGRPPFAGSPDKLRQAHLYEEPPSPGNDIPPVLGDVLRRMMAKDPAARPSLDEIREAIEAALGEGCFGTGATDAGDAEGGGS
jgi:predicted Ser/Thr protein kinase